MNKLVLITAVLMAFVLTSCEKENVAEVVENNTKPANFVLLQKGYIDESGNVGDLYVDENDSTNMYYEIYERTRQRPFEGTLYRIMDHGIVLRYECSGEATNCWNVEINGQIVPGWLDGTVPIDVMNKL